MARVAIGAREARPGADPDERNAVGSENWGTGTEMHGRQLESILVRLAVIGTLIVASLLLAAPASAEVIANERITFTVTNINPCAPGDGPVTLTFEEHDVWQQLADGTLLVHSNFHGTGTSANGTAYIANRHQVTTVVNGVAAATFDVVRISQGSGDNVQIEGTFTFDPNRVPPRIQIATFRCVG